ncbi:MAG TPA: YqgE/AlgH family protein [Gammaproteobacteria bacterium]
MNAKHTPAAPCTAPRRPARGWARAALLLVGAALAVSAAAQPRVGQGSLLVATDEIGDPSWSRTVVLVLHHGPNGTLGIAINRPTEVEPKEIVPDLGDLPGLAHGVFRGGPVQPTQLVFLVRNPPLGMLRDAPRILEDVYASGDLAALPQIIEAGGGETLRLYAGRVEWGPGQLDSEIADERWTVAMGSADRVFAPNPTLLWQRLRAAGDELLVDGSTRHGSAAADVGTAGVWHAIEPSGDDDARTSDHQTAARGAP